VLETTGDVKNHVVLGINNLTAAELIKNELPPDRERELRPLQLHTLEFIRQRERKAVEERKKESAKIGTGVSSHAQTLFDSLSKTLPCEWKDTSILVMHSIRIDSPYGAANVVNLKGSGDEIAFNRVKLMVEKEAARLQSDKT